MATGETAQGMPGPIRVRDVGRVRIVEIDNPPVNALSTAVRAGLVAAVAAADVDPAVVAVVLAGAGGRFVAGADIREFGKPAEPPSLPEVMAALDSCGKPLIAAIEGHALGGGLELALACDLRIAAASARLGLPEVKLGIIPGAGGTQRLPRAIGVTAAIDLIATGRAFGAEEARAAGIVDRVVGEVAVEVAAAFAASAGKRRLSEIPTPSVRAAEIDIAASRIRASDPPPNTAQRAAIEVVAAAARLSFEDGLKLERDTFLKLRDSAEAAELRAKFLAERQRAKAATKPSA